MREKLFNLVNAVYTLLTLALVFFVANYFLTLFDIPEWVVILILVLSAIVFLMRMYLKYSRRRK